MDKDLKDLLNSSIQGTMQAVQTHQENAAEEKKRSSEFKKGCFSSFKKGMKWYLIASAVCIVICYISVTQEDRSDKKVIALIEKGNYIKAKQVAAKGSEQSRYKVTNAQVTELIEQGNFDLANEIAKEDRLYIAFFNGIIDHLTKIYTQQGSAQLFYAMSLIVYPDAKSESLPENWGKVSGEEVKDILLRSNKNIESFCDYIQLTDDRTMIPKMLGYLKPIYHQPVKEWNSNKQKYVIVKESYLETSDVKRIKAKFGY